MYHQLQMVLCSLSSATFSSGRDPNTNFSRNSISSTMVKTELRLSFLHQREHRSLRNGSCRNTNPDIKRFQISAENSTKGDLTVKVLEKLLRERRKTAASASQPGAGVIEGCGATIQFSSKSSNPYLRCSQHFNALCPVNWWINASQEKFLQKRFI